jgi:hypothetical protein
VASIYTRADSRFLGNQYKDAAGKRKCGSTGFRKDNLHERNEAQELAKRKSEDERKEKSDKRMPIEERMFLTGVRREIKQNLRSDLAKLKHLGPAVYLIKSGDSIKVGSTADLRDRMGDYSTHNHDWRLIGVRSFTDLSKAKEFEEEMLTGFAEYRSGEKRTD